MLGCAHHVAHSTAHAVYLFSCFLFFGYGCVVTIEQIDMAYHIILLALSLICSHSVIALGLDVPKPRQIAFSQKSYGPDGPWQAVTVLLGTPSQSLDLYPGGAWVSNILNTSVCENTKLTPVCYGKDAGLFNSKASNTFEIRPETGPMKNGTSDGSADGFRVSLAEYGQNTFAFDSLDLGSTQEQAHLVIPSFDLDFQIEGYSTLPDGSTYTIQMGNLALGAQEYNQTWPSGPGKPNVNGTFLPNYLHQNNYTTSTSYGLHIGSASLGIPGSLWIGGYDQSRVLGPVSQQSYGSTWLPIDLLDIGISVAEGQSPFNVTSRIGLLAHGNSSIGVKQEVWIEPTIPYLYLPHSTCDAIASYLPVTYSPRLGLFLWNTSSPSYTAIISSPALLTFTFRLNSSLTQNFTINVPFGLLNLTLTPPLSPTPIPYFPCRPSNTSVYTLGRAFLQAAFIGVNWMVETNHHGVWWLAQAPGPNTPSVPVTVGIMAGDRFVVPSANTWLDSWKGVWTPIGATEALAGNGSGTAGSDAKGGLSTAVKVGVATAVSFAVVFLIVVLFFYLRRGIRDRPPLTIPRSPTVPDWGQGDDKKAAGWGPREMEGRETREAVELGVPCRAVTERERRRRERYELGGMQRPAEMEG